jgi:predicted dehydrogenase
LRYPAGLIASLHCGFNAQKCIASEIIGTDAMLEVPDTFLGDAGALTLTRGDERREIPVPASDRYRLELEDFSEAIFQKRAPRLGLAESLRNAQVMDRLLAASR